MGRSIVDLFSTRPDRAPWLRRTFALDDDERARTIHQGDTRPEHTPQFDRSGRRKTVKEVQVEQKKGRWGTVEEARAFIAREEARACREVCLAAIKGLPVRDRLNAMFVASGLSQREVSHRLKITPSHLNRLVTQHANPSVVMAMKIAGVFGVSVEDIWKE